MVNPRGLLGRCCRFNFCSWAPWKLIVGWGPGTLRMARDESLEVIAPNLLTVKLVNPDRLLHVRLLGVGSPRNRDRIKTLDHEVITYIQKNALWDESRKYVESLVHGKLVEIWTRKWDRVDDKHRLLAYILVPNGGSKPLDVNAEIIKKGFGFVTRDYVHVTFADYKRLEQEARKNRLGIWRGLLNRYSTLTK